ncbi:MAG: hypothetical protein AABX10_03740 [Nanoarchaeota archaeon]
MTASSVSDRKSPFATVSKRGYLNSLFLGVIALSGCDQTPPCTPQNYRDSRIYNCEISTKDFVNSLPPNAQVLVGYNRWDYSPGPGNFPKFPNKEVLVEEARDPKNSNNHSRLDSINGALSLVNMLEKRGVQPYITSLQSSNPEHGFYTRDFVPDYIIASEVTLNTEQLKRLNLAHNHVKSRSAPGSTKVPASLKIYYLHNDFLEEIVEGK